MTIPIPNDQAGAANVPWARQPSAPTTRATSRARRVVTDLPPWEPLPPGEILVQRQRLE